MYPGFEDPIEEVDISKYIISDILADKLEHLNYEDRFSATGAYLNRSTFGFYLMLYRIQSNYSISEFMDEDIEKFKKEIEQVLRERLNIPKEAKSEIVSEDDEDPIMGNVSLVWMFEIDEETRDNIYLLSRISE